MAVSAHETALAQEGGSATSEELRAAFAEQFTLAVDVEAKRSLVASQLVPKSADALYFSSLCTLLELQSLLDEKQFEADEQAWALLAAQKPHLESAVFALRTTYYAEKRAARLQGRLLLLQLELSHRLNRPTEELKVCGGLQMLNWNLCDVLTTLSN